MTNRAMSILISSLCLLLFASGISIALPTTNAFILSRNVTGEINKISGTTPMLVYIPTNYSKADPEKRFPLVIALHGWNHSPELWRQSTDFSKLANKYGFVIAIPNMGRTIYESSFYPETTGTWRTAPGSRWIGEVVLPYMRKEFKVYTDRAHTGIIGYSTGGRGALLVAEIYPEFAFIGSLSGTFDLIKLKPAEGEYKIHAIIYGSRDTFPDRWKKDNCIEPARISTLSNVQLFIGHGKADTSVKPNQVDFLRNALKGKSTSIKVEYTIISNEGHTWKYWNSQLPKMFKKMDKVIGK